MSWRTDVPSINITRQITTPAKYGWYPDIVHDVKYSPLLSRRCMINHVAAGEIRWVDAGSP